MAKANTHSRMSRGDRIFDSINVVLLGLLALIIIYPLVYVLSASFSDPVSVASGDMILWPLNVTLENYAEVFKNQSIITGYRNSLIILVSGTALNLVMTVLAAFPMSRRDLWGRNVMMKLMTFTMFFSGGLIPTYLLITRTLGLMNSWLALILPGAISVYNMIIMRTYFQTSIPYELQEAADIDGCSPFGVLIRIILPLSGPILAVIGLYYGVGHWNSYFSALFVHQPRGASAAAALPAQGAHPQFQPEPAEHGKRRGRAPGHARRDDQVCGHRGLERADAGDLSVCSEVLRQRRHDRCD